MFSKKITTFYVFKDTGFIEFLERILYFVISHSNS